MTTLPHPSTLQRWMDDHLTMAARSGAAPVAAMHAELADWHRQRIVAWIAEPLVPALPSGR